MNDEGRMMVMHHHRTRLGWGWKTAHARTYNIMCAGDWDGSSLMKEVVHGDLAMKDAPRFRIGNAKRSYIGVDKGVGGLGGHSEDDCINCTKSLHKSYFYSTYVVLSCIKMMRHHRTRHSWGCKTAHARTYNNICAGERLLGGKMDEIHGAVGQEERDVEERTVMFEVEHGIAEAQQWGVALGVGCHALAFDAVAGLGIDGDDVILILKQELQLGTVTRGPVAHGHVCLGEEALQDVVLGQCSTKFLEQISWSLVNIRLHTSQSTKDAYVKGIDLENGEILVGRHGQKRFVADTDLIDESCPAEPQQGILVLAGTGTRAYKLIDELTILFGQLRWQRLPYVVYLVGHDGRGVLDEVKGIVLQDVCQLFFGLGHVAIQHCCCGFWHTSTDAVCAECFHEAVEKDLRQWFQGADGSEVGKEACIACSQELRECDGVHVEMINFTNREGETVMTDGYAKQGTSTDYGIFWCLFTEIFQSCQCFWAGLYFVKDDECGLRENGVLCEERKLLNNALGIFGALEDFGNVGLFVQTEIGAVGETTLSKMSENPCLAYLTSSKEQKGLAVGLVLPSLQLCEDGTFYHKRNVPKMCVNTRFTYEFCAKIHIIHETHAKRRQKK